MKLWIPATYTAWGVIARISELFGSSAAKGPNPVWFHAASLLAHIAASVALFMLLRRLCASHVAAAIGAALFAAHPVQVETIAWASGLKDVLCGMFVIVSLWQYVTAVQRAGEEENARPWSRLHYGAATLAFVLAMLSKPTAIITPALALAIDLIILQRGSRRSIAWLWPWIALAVPVAIVAKLVQPASANAASAVPLYLRPLVAGDAIAFYLGKVVWPVNLAVDYGRNPSIAIERGWIAYMWLVPVIAGIIVALFARRRPLLAAGACLFAIGVAPVLGIVPFDFQVYSTVADHYLYISMVGVALVVVEGVSHLSTRAAFICAAPVLLLLGAQSWTQAIVWHDTISLFKHTLEINPESYVSHTSLAAAYLDQREPSTAEQHARAAIGLNPAYSRGYATLGAALARQSQLEDATIAYRDAIRLNPDNARARSNLGGLLSQLGNDQEAIEQLNRAIELDPTEAQAHINLGLIYASRNPEQALEHMRAAVNLWPRDARSHVNLGYVLLLRGQSREAANEFGVALTFDPSSAGAREGLERAGAGASGQARSDP